MIGDLERLADAEQPGLKVENLRIDLAALAAARAQAFSELFQAAGIRFDQRLEPMGVSGEPGRLEQVIDNLLSNALRYTDRGGTVGLRITRAADTAVLEVADTGIGITPTDTAHVFERFWRADRSRSRATGGAGIGLTIVRELVRAHGRAGGGRERTRGGLHLPRDAPPRPSGGRRQASALRRSYLKAPGAAETVQARTTSPVSESASSTCTSMACGTSNVNVGFRRESKKKRELGVMSTGRGAAASATRSLPGVVVRLP